MSERGAVVRRGVTMGESRFLDRSISRRRSLQWVTGGAAGLIIGGQQVASLAQPSEDIDFYARRMTRAPFSERNVDAAVSALALAGIPVYGDADQLLPLVPVPGSRSPVKLLLWQVRNMALELSAGSGRKGADLDEVIPSPEGAPPVSYLLAGYVQTATTPGGELARALTGDSASELPPDQVFPTLVITLFVSDVAVDQGGVAKSYAPARSAEPSGVCTSIQKFTDEVIAAVFNALKVGEPGSKKTTLLEDIWNWIVGAGQTVVEGAVDTLTAPVIVAIQAITGVLAIGASISSMLQAWTVTVDSQPAMTHFGVDDEFVTGKVVASIDVGGQTDWPSELASCAAASGIALPSLQGEGSAVTWKASELPIDLVQEMGKSPLVETNGIAEYIYKTNNESADVASGTPLEGLCIVEVWVERSDLAQLRDNLLAILATNIPAPFGAAVEAILGPAIASLTSDLAKTMVKGYGFDTVKVIYHEKQITVTPEPEQPEEPEEPGQGSCPVGTWYMANFTAWFQAMMGQSGAGVMNVISEGGRVILELRPDGTFEITSDGFSVSFTDGTFGYIAELYGSETGTYEIGEGVIIGVKSSGNLTLTVNAEGFFETELPFGVFGGSVPYECTEGVLLMTPPGASANKVRWAPYNPN